MGKSVKQEKEFEELCEQFMPMVYGLISKWRLAGDREEFIQIGRIAFYEAWCAYDSSQGAFPAFAKSYVYGRFKQSLERKNRWTSRHIPVEPSVLSEADWIRTVEDDSTLLLDDWLASTSLSPREQLWVREGLFEGYKPNEIAGRWRVSRSTVKTWRKNALKKLRSEGYEW